LIRLAIIGTRGIPASYSGFETSVQETAIRFAMKGIDTSVYCRQNHYKKYYKVFKGVRLIYLPSIRTKHLDTLTHTLLSIIHAMWSKYDTIIIYGIGNSFFLPFIKLFVNNVITVVDGADWDRRKWNFLAKRILRIGKFFAVKFSDSYVVDNEKLLDEYMKSYGGNGIYIPYGANKINSYNSTVLDKHGVKEQEYIIFIGRFVKEKNLEFLINNYNLLNTTIKLLIVGGNDVDLEYDKRIRSYRSDKVIFTGFVYGQDYESLLKGALFYISCSLLEGTSPSLLSAMAINGFAVVSNISENIETLKGSCESYESGNDIDFREKMQYFLNDAGKIDPYRTQTRKIINKHYDWDKIANSYVNLLNK
jgi:glycosyltransferase involved in cell wall biosynthesis